MTDDPELARDIAAMRAFLADVDRLIRRSRGRILTPNERAGLRQITAVLAEFHAAVTFELAPSEAAAVRRLLGPTPSPERSA